MARIRQILVAVCYFLLLETTVGETFTHQHVLDFLNISEDISHADEQKLALELTGLLETFLELTELALQMNQEVDQWLSGGGEISMEFESYLEECDNTKNTYLEVKVAVDDALHDDSKRTELFTYLPQAIAKSEPITKYWELEEENAKFLEKMFEKTNLSIQMLKIMDSHMKKIGIQGGTKPDPETAIDEETVYARGRILTKMLKLFLFYYKKLEASSKTLEKLGYYNSTNDSNEETIISKIIERELAVVEETKEKLFSVISESKNVLPPRNMFSFAFDMIDIKNKKLDEFTEECRKRGEEGLHRKQLVVEAQSSLHQSLSKFVNSLRDEF